MNRPDPANQPRLGPLPRRWQPAAIFWISVGVHVLALAVVLISSDQWTWALAALVVNHLILSTVGLWPRSQVLGENIVRLPRSAAVRSQVALTFDDGPDPLVTPLVLALLARHGAKASFFCVAERAKAHPDMIREIVRQGHSIENHSLRHPNSFACFGPVRLIREVQGAQGILTELAGQAPLFFRAPAGLRNPFLPWVMARLGLHYISWTRRGFDAVRGEPLGVLRRLTRRLAAGDVLLLHDGYPAKTPAGLPVVLEVLPLLLQELERRSLVSVSLRTAFGEIQASADYGRSARTGNAASAEVRLERTSS